MHWGTMDMMALASTYGLLCTWGVCAWHMQTAVLQACVQDHLTRHTQTIIAASDILRFQTHLTDLDGIPESVDCNSTCQWFSQPGNESGCAKGIESISYRTHPCQCTCMHVNAQVTNPVNSSHRAPKLSPKIVAEPPWYSCGILSNPFSPSPQWHHADSEASSGSLLASIDIPSGMTACMAQHPESSRCVCARTHERIAGTHTAHGCSSCDMPLLTMPNTPSAAPHLQHSQAAPAAGARQQAG